MSENPKPNEDFIKSKRALTDAVSTVIDVLSAKSVSDQNPSSMGSVESSDATNQMLSVFDLTEIVECQPFLSLISPSIEQAVETYGYFTGKNTQQSPTYYPHLMIVNETFSDELFETKQDWIVNVPQYYGVVISANRLLHQLDKASDKEQLNQILEQISLAYLDFLIKVNTAHKILSPNSFLFGDTEILSQRPLGELSGDIRDDNYPIEGTPIHGVVAIKSTHHYDKPSVENTYETISNPVYQPIAKWFHKLDYLQKNNQEHNILKDRARHFADILYPEGITLDSYTIAVPIFLSPQRNLSQNVSMIDLDTASEWVFMFMLNTDTSEEEMQSINMLSMLSYLDPSIISVFRHFITTGETLSDAGMQSNIQREIKKYITRYEDILNIPIPDKRKRALNSLHKDVASAVWKKINNRSTS